MSRCAFDVISGPGNRLDPRTEFAVTGPQVARLDPAGGFRVGVAGRQVAGDGDVVGEVVERNVGT